MNQRSHCECLSSSIRAYLYTIHLKLGLLIVRPFASPVVVRTPSLIGCMCCKFHQAHGDRQFDVVHCLKKQKQEQKIPQIICLLVHGPTSPMKNITYLCEAPRIQIQGCTGWSLPVTLYSALAVISENNADLIFLYYGFICADIHSYS